MKSHRAMRSLLGSVTFTVGVAFTVLGGLSAVAGRRAMAGEEERACAAAYERAQERERSAHLLEAKELFQSCAKASCGSILHQACTTKHTQIDADIPTIVPLVTDETGAPRVDVQVTMDGDSLTDRLDGRAVAVDPGMHELTFSAGGRVIATRKVLVAQGQRNRTITISMRAGDKNGQKTALAAVDTSGAGGETEGAAPQAPAIEASAGEPPGKSGFSALTYSLGGVGLAGLGGFALLTQWGRHDNDLLGQCAPNCSQASVDHIHRMYLAADISLGVGLAALGAAYFVFAHNRAANQEGHKDDHEQSSDEALLFDVQPTKSGAFATVSGSF